MYCETRVPPFFAVLAGIGMLGRKAHCRGRQDQITHDESDDRKRLATIYIIVKYDTWQILIIERLKTVALDAT